MKSVEKLLLGMVIGFGICMLVSMLTSCSRSITPFQAANGQAKCGRWLR